MSFLLEPDHYAKIHSLFEDNGLPPCTADLSLPESCPGESMSMILQATINKFQHKLCMKHLHIRESPNRPTNCAARLFKSLA